MVQDVFVQWVFWAFSAGVIVAVIYLFIYERNNKKVHKIKAARRDELLSQMMQLSERIKPDDRMRMDCSRNHSR